MKGDFCLRLTDRADQIISRAKGYATFNHEPRKLHVERKCIGPPRKLLSNSQVVARVDTGAAAFSLVPVAAVLEHCAS